MPSLPWGVPLGRFCLSLGWLVSVPLAVGCNQPNPSAISSQPPATQAATAEPHDVRLITNRLRPTVEAFCQGCHVMPQPSSSPRDEWAGEVEQGYGIYEAMGRTDLKVPPRADVIRYFESLAPEQLTLSASIFGLPHSAVPFVMQPGRLSGPRPPGIANVAWMPLQLGPTDQDRQEWLVYCDISTGAVNAVQPSDKSATVRKLATLLQPVHAAGSDLNRDGEPDLLVADIGEFVANDSDLGRIVWLCRKAESETFEPIVVCDGLSRTAAAQAVDLDGDEDTDILVAEFGWRNSGRILWLENLVGSEIKGIESFRVHVIDKRPGAIHVVPSDLDADGDQDFVALISQDQEVVEAFFNDGKGSFTTKTVWRAPDPSYGSSGIQLVDLDQDRDLDVLYTNGDPIDRGVKVHHSIQWLENRGEFPFVHHHLAYMPGVERALAADFDGDGDLDIVACSLVPDPRHLPLLGEDAASILMLTQTGPGVFQASAIERANHRHMSLDVGDFDQNGKVDFAVSHFVRFEGSDLPEYLVFWNR